MTRPTCNRWPCPRPSDVTDRQHGPLCSRHARSILEARLAFEALLDDPDAMAWLMADVLGDTAALATCRQTVGAA